MSEIAEKIRIEGGYVVEIHYDNDAFNPLKEYDSSPTLVLHGHAEQNFGWTTNKDWGTKLNEALDRLANGWFERAHRQVEEHGEWQAAERSYAAIHGRPRDYALGVIARWLRTYHGIPVALPVSAMEHSGTTVYLGDGAHWADPGGWDSGWVGWLFATAEQLKDWYDGNPTVEQVEHGLRGSFSEFKSWVEGDTYGYVVTHEDGGRIDDDSCWGFYGSESFDERVETEVPARALQVGMHMKSLGEVLEIARVEEEEPGVRGIEFTNGECDRQGDEQQVTIVHPGYMREAFMEVVESDRKERAEAAAKLAAELAADAAEIEELRLAEVGS